MSTPIRLLSPEDYTGASGTISVSQLAKYSYEPRIVMLLIDDRPTPKSLCSKFNLTDANTVFFYVKDMQVAYDALLFRPSPFDVIFIDWRLDGWARLGYGYARQTGLPDNLARGGLFTRVFPPPTGIDPDHVGNAQDGGHAELLISMAAARGAFVVALSEYTTHMGESALRRLHACGAWRFLNKPDLDDQAELPSVQEVRRYLFPFGGRLRDQRLWRTPHMSDLAGVLDTLGRIPPAELWHLFNEAESRQTTASAESPDFPDAEARIRYLIKSLPSVRQARLFCASRLLDVALPLLRQADPRRGRKLLRIVEVLQPSLRSDDGLISSLHEQFGGQMTHVAAACRRIERHLPGAESLHVFVGPRLTRLDFFGAKAGTRPGRPAIEHLGTSFRPLLATNPDDDGVWPAYKNSKLRHLLRVHREQRFFHHGKAIIRCKAGVFGPTIDSMLLGTLLVRAFKGQGGPLANVKRIAEIGVGTGYLLCLAGLHAPKGLESLAGADIDPAAVDCANQNLKENCPGLADRTHVTLSKNLLRDVAPGKLDLIISNPPYLPDQPSAEATGKRRGSAIAGEKVIRDILVDAGPIALAPNGLVLLVTSTLSARILEASIKEAEKIGIHWHTAQVAELPWVPLDLPDVHEDLAWISRLLEEDAPHVVCDLAAPVHLLRHGVVVTALSRNQAALARFRAHLASDHGPLR